MNATHWLVIVVISIITLAISFFFAYLSAYSWVFLTIAAFVLLSGAASIGFMLFFAGAKVHPEYNQEDEDEAQIQFLKNRAK